MAASLTSASSKNDSLLSSDEELRLIDLARTKIKQTHCKEDVSVLLEESGRIFVGRVNKSLYSHEVLHSEVAVFQSLTPHVVSQNLKFIYIVTCTEEEIIGPPCLSCQEILKKRAPGIVSLRASTKTAEIGRYILS